MGGNSRSLLVAIAPGMSLPVMLWWYHIPTVLWCAWVFLAGLMVGSFLNVLIARLPYEKSVVWPGSRCGSCYRPIRLLDNTPILGYLRLRGRCRFCKASFSSRYLWVELGTALAFVALFLIEIVAQAEGGPGWLRPWHTAPGLRYSYMGSNTTAGPPIAAWVYFAAHACLLALLIAAAVIDAEHKIIPTQITYPGTVIGLLCAVVLPWPWPTDPAAAASIPPLAWVLEGGQRIPTGVVLWPFAGPPPDWAPPGSWQLGLMNGLVGAAVGTFLVRVFKFLFEWGFGQEALGLGDADLLMMVGAFLGWQVAFLGFFAGAFAALALMVPTLLWKLIRGKGAGSELPFGPGLAVGVVLVWFGWPALGTVRQILFEPILTGAVVGIMCVGLLAAGALLRRK